MSDLEFLFVLLLAAAGLVRLAELIRVPYPIVLVLGGLAIGLVPGLPNVELEPDVVFLVFLPPLLVAAAYYASPQELIAERGPLIWLTVGLVAATIAVIGVVAHAVVDGLPWAAAFALGAIVAPTDPVAAIATFRRGGVPARVRLIVEGESMLNDATGLVAFRVAVAAAAGGTSTSPTRAVTSSRRPSAAWRSGSSSGGPAYGSSAGSRTSSSPSCGPCCSPTAPTSRPRRRTRPASSRP